MVVIIVMFSLPLVIMVSANVFSCQGTNKFIEDSNMTDSAEHSNLITVEIPQHTVSLGEHNER